MTPEGLKAATDARDKVLWNVIKDPEKHKVCDCCWSISRKEVPVCPVCLAYRWRERVRTVQACVRKIFRRGHPFPLTLGYVPRIMQSK